MTLQESMEHWYRLADDEEAMGKFYDEQGKPYGDTSHYYKRAKLYRRVAQVQRLQLETGKPHCLACLGDHPDHLHPHRG